VMRLGARPIAVSAVAACSRAAGWLEWFE
jgi:hypothetical protein